MDKYIIYGKIGEGSFSEVLKAKFNSQYNWQTKSLQPEFKKCTDSLKSSQINCDCEAEFVAIKCIKNEEANGNRNNGVSTRSLLPPIIGQSKPRNKQPIQYENPNNSSLFLSSHLAALESKEVFALKVLKPHPNIIQLYDVFKDPLTSRICIVTELLDMNVYEYLQSLNGRPIPEEVVKGLMWQALSGLSHVHSSGFFHRDIKPENMLLSKETMTLKLADFGSCHETDSRPPYTEYIATRWYRAPECLLTIGHYSLEMDIWSIGCVMCELLTGRPLFPGKNETQQLQCIQKLLGPPPFALFRRSPNLDLTNCPLLSTTFPPMQRHQQLFTLESILTGISAECIDLIKSMLSYSPSHRISASSALCHSFFISLVPPKSLTSTVDSPHTSTLTRSRTPSPLSSPDKAESSPRKHSLRRNKKIREIMSNQYDSKEFNFENQSKINVYGLSRDEDTNDNNRTRKTHYNDKDIPQNLEMNSNWDTFVTQTTVSTTMDSTLMLKDSQKLSSFESVTDNCISPSPSAFADSYTKTPPVETALLCSRRKPSSSTKLVSLKMKLPSSCQREVHKQDNSSLVSAVNPESKKAPKRRLRAPLRLFRNLTERNNHK